MNGMGWLVAAALAAAPASGGELKRLDAGCAQVQKAYPLLMMAAMAEGPMDCGTPDTGPVDCDAGDSPENAARQAKRLEIRKRQERVFETASTACDLYAKHRKDKPVQEATAMALALAAQVGTTLPDELADSPPAPSE